MKELGLGPQAQQFRAAAREFIDQVVVPVERQVTPRDVEGLDRACAQLREQARAAGFFAPDLWAQWRESSINWRMRQLQLEAAGRSPLGAGAMHCAPPDTPNIDLLERIANSEQRERYLEPLLQARFRSCFAMTEPAPGAGSDPSMILTRARRDGRRWILNGHKWFASGAVGARLAIVVAQTADGPTLFIVQTDNPGWQLVRSLHSLDGFQLGSHGEVRLVDCVVDDADRLGDVGKALDYAQMRLEPARLAHCMRMVGRAERVMEVAQAYVQERRSFGSALGSMQAVQMLVADSHIDLHAARLVTWQVAARMDAGESVKQESGIAKVFVSEAVSRVADRAVQLTGAYGTLFDEPIAQFYEEVRPFRIYDGASEVHRVAIGKRVLRQTRGSSPVSVRTEAQ